MLLPLAWKNIWRNKLRSAVIITAIALGLMCGLTAAAIYINIGTQMVSSTITTGISHLQISNPKFLIDREVNNFVPNAEVIAKRIDSLPQVAAAAPRMLVNGMASSPQTALGVQITGIIAEREKNLTSIASSLLEGNYFEEPWVNQVVIGQELARHLDLDLGSRIVFTFVDVNGELTGSAFRICGIFRTASTQFDRSTVYVKARELGQLLETGMRFQQVAVLFTTLRAADTSLNQIQKIVPEMELQTWRQLAPQLDFMSSSMSLIMYIFLGVILLTLSFGIINTMLMVVLERKREFGMLMAVGMGHKLLFFLVTLETVILSISGAAIGMFLAFILISTLNVTGINLAALSSGLREFGIAEVLYPSLPLTMYPAVGGMVFITAVLSAIYPALRALRLRPAEALRNI
ncbi:MAG: ABC transporter permease [Chitinispirillales bacterium]|jgi:ABC-type lipoprotein release transport system permease subunit|nr:ABC transporter permease [Chitinispirillales bacterium]